MKPSLSRSLVANAALATFLPSNNPDPVAQFIENSSRHLDASLQGRIKTESTLYEGLVAKRDELDFKLKTKQRQSRSVLDTLEQKHAALIDSLKALYAELNALNVEGRKNPKDFAEANAQDAAQKNAILEKSVTNSKQAKGEVKALYRKIVKKCHPDNNEKDEVLVAAMVAARSALEQESLAAMQDIYQMVMDYKTKTGAERRLTSLIKKNDDLKRSIQHLLRASQQLNSTFEGLAAQLHNQPDTLEPEFLKIVNHSINLAKQQIDAIKAYKAQQSAGEKVEMEVVDKDFNRIIDTGTTSV